MSTRFSSSLSAECIPRSLLACAKMKKYMALWGSLFFLVICCSLYLMMETVNMNNKINLRPYDIDENDFDSIETKIHKVEQDIRKNHETIREIKKILRRIAGGDKSGINKLKHLFDREDHEHIQKDKEVVENVLKHELDSIQHAPRTEVLLPEGICPAFKTQAKSDIMIRKVYDTLAFDNIDGGVWKQGWNITYDPKQWDNTEKLQVFVVPHTHNDPGWIKTFVSYYQQQTRSIFENMVEQLELKKEMKLIYAEMSFFSLWWDEISPEKRKRVKALIEKGQLEIVTGGWVMNDEANAHYFAIIDQLIEGHLWLNGTLGVKPQASWSIDPFGLSPTMAYILKKMGFKDMLIQRVHYSIKKHLAKSKELEFMWRQEWDNTGRTDIFCHMMPFYSYDIPHTCGPDPKVCCQFDFRRLPGLRYSCPWKIAPVPISEDNVASRAETLLDQYRKKAQLYRQNILFVPLGDDFRYEKSDEWVLQYENYKKLFDYMNSQPHMRVEAKFGTLSDYFNAIYKKHKIQPGIAPPNLPSLSGDFFTYADRDDHYWSGFYTSRPFQKILNRQMEYQLRGAELLFYLVSQYTKNMKFDNFSLVDFMQGLVNARRNLALFQHHDAITGTAKDFVVDDYGERLLSAMLEMKRLTTEAITFIMLKDKEKYSYSAGKTLFDIDEEREKHYSLPARTVLKVNENPQPVLIYNSLGHKREHVVKVYVNSAFVVVKDPSGQIIPAQVDLFWTDRESVSSNKYKVSFVVIVPALGISRYTIERVTPEKTTKAKPSEITLYNSNLNIQLSSKFFTIKKLQAKPFSIENSYMTASFHPMSGLLKNVTFKSSGITHPVNIKFVYYGTRATGDKSGAYLFLPDGIAQEVIVASPFIRITKGPIVSEVTVFLEDIEHVVRLHNSPGTDGVSIDIYNIVDIRKRSNREFAMRIHTDIKSEDNSFYTDLNGFQMQRRKTYAKLPLQANYFPMPTAMFVENNLRRFNILSGQSLGAAYLKPGELEVMLDRRLNQDDNRGLAQGVLDNKRTPNRFRLLLETRKPSAALDKSIEVKHLSLQTHLASLHLIHPFYIAPKNSLSHDQELLPVFSGLNSELSCDVHLLNLRTLQNKDDDPKLKFVPRNSAALILHRFSFDCDFPNRGLLCSVGDGKVSISSMFKDIKFMDIHAASLSLLYENKTVIQSSIEIKPMDISAFKLTAATIS